jgi:hypothetical protein
LIRCESQFLVVRMKLGVITWFKCEDMIVENIGIYNPRLMWL